MIDRLGDRSARGEPGRDPPLQRRELRAVGPFEPVAQIFGEQLMIAIFAPFPADRRQERSEEHTSELQSLMRISYAVFCLKKKKNYTRPTIIHIVKEINAK